MTDVVSAPKAPTGTGPGLVARLVGVLLEPRATYAAVADHPRWLGVLTLTLLLTAGAYYVIMSSPALQDQVLVQQARALQASGQTVSDQQMAGLETFLGYLPVIVVCAVLFIGPIVSTIIAGILMTIFTTLLGGQGTFRQVFAVIAHSGVITTCSALFSAGMMAAGVEPTGARAPGANLGVFLPMLEEGSFAASLLGAIDLFLVWWLISLAIGLATLYKRSSTVVAGTFLGLYALLALAIAALSSGA